VVDKRVLNSNKRQKRQTGDHAVEKIGESDNRETEGQLSLQVSAGELSDKMKGCVQRVYTKDNIIHMVRAAQGSSQENSDGHPEDSQQEFKLIKEDKYLKNQQQGSTKCASTNSSDHDREQNELLRLMNIESSGSNPKSADQSQPGEDGITTSAQKAIMQITSHIFNLNC
jgi:hypothetical protein